MIEVIDRVVDLVGPRSAALTGSTLDEVVAAVAKCDTTRLAATDGHFAVCARNGKTIRLARTIGIPLRYFVAKMDHGPFLVVSDRVDRIFEWCNAQRLGWQFDPAYTRMVPAHHVVEVDQVGCPDPAPRYHRFFDPAIGQASDDLDEAGRSYITSAYATVKSFIGGTPEGTRVAVSFSGGVDSTAVLLMALRAMEELRRDPTDVRAFTLDLGAGPDAVQAADAVRALGLEQQWEVIEASSYEVDLEAALRAIEDYHPLDVECAAASLCLLRGIRRRHPEVTHLLDGDGGDENLKSYPLEDSDLTLSSVLRNPLLYQEGWGVDAIKHSVTYSGGLSRSYVRTAAPAAQYGFNAFSPFSVRSVVAAALAIPFDRVVNGDVDRLYSLKRDVVGKGVRRVLGVDMPLNPKRRFQDGSTSIPRTRASKVWCRTVFNRYWEEKLRDTADPLSRTREAGSVYEMTAIELSPFV